MLDAQQKILNDAAISAADTAESTATVPGRTKSGLLSHMASDNGSLLHGINESTCCHSGVLDEELLVNFPVYSLMWRDRDSKNEGDVYLFLKSTLLWSVGLQ